MDIKNAFEGASFCEEGALQASIYNDKSRKTRKKIMTET